MFVPVVFVSVLFFPLRFVYLLGICLARMTVTGEPEHVPWQPSGDLPREQQVRLRGTPVF